jgi:hypothetical protein
LTLCYFNSSAEKDPKGWIYLKDISQLADDGKVITITTPSRKLVLEAHSRAEHRLWLQGLIDYCPFLGRAGIEGIQSDINLRNHGATEPPVSVASSKSRSSSANKRLPVPIPSSSAYVTSGSLPKKEFDAKDDAKGYEDPRDSPGRSRDRAFSRHAYPGSSFDKSMTTAMAAMEVPPVDGIDSNLQKEKGLNRRQNSFQSGNAHNQRGGVSSYGSTMSSRLNSHITKNNSSSSTSNDAGRDSNLDFALDSEAAGVEVDYVSLSADKLEPTRVRLQQYEVENAVQDDRMNFPAHEGHEEKEIPLSRGNIAARPSVSHFSSVNGSSIREVALSVDDLISLSAGSGNNSACNSARRPVPQGRAPPTSSYNPRRSRDYDNVDSDEEEIDLRVSIHVIY